MSESVSCWNFICEWIKRKLNMMHNPTLEELCIKKIYHIYHKNKFEDIPIEIREKYE